MTYTQVWDHMTGQPSETTIQRDEDGAFIPMDPDNVDCQEYMAWLDEGNAPKSATPPASTLPETLPVEDRVATLEEQVADLNAMVIPR